MSGAGQRRPERRRPRRGRSRGRDRDRDQDRAREPGAAKAVSREERPVEDEDEMEAGLLDLPEAMDEDDEDADSASAKAGFRSIPTWEEAVGILVSANLESRARRPGNGGPPGRGGRGSRDRSRPGGNRGPRSGKRR